jgi:alpha-L-arabinofuranosidase
VKLTQRLDGWYLELVEDKVWRDEAKRELVTTVLLGKAKVSGCAYENPDGTPLRINTDYFGKNETTKNPFPGPFELSGRGQQNLRVWPIANAD